MKTLRLYLGPVYSRLADERDLKGLDVTKLPINCVIDCAVIKPRPGKPSSTPMQM